MADTSHLKAERILPAAPLPPPINGETPGTWANRTMSQRVRDIARRTLAENDFSPPVGERVEGLIAEIPGAPLRPLQYKAPDADAWRGYVQPYAGHNWLTPPWLLTETYFYRRVIEATGFYEVGDPGFKLDPFRYQKEQGLSTNLPAIGAIAERVQSWIADGFQEEHLVALLAIALWGNRADLSLWPADDQGDKPQDVNWGAAAQYNLDDDTVLAVRHFVQEPVERIDLIADNAGLELIADMALVDYLLTTDTAANIYVHLKPHPTFVSDAMAADLQDTIRFLKEQQGPIAHFGRRLEQHMDTKRLLLRDDPYWVSPLAFWEVPSHLSRELAHSSLIISKGDANYRRLLGDRHWPFTMPFADILSYTPAPLLALRTLKAELACGLRQQDIDRLNGEDPDWLTNGRWGVIQFAWPHG